MPDFSQNYLMISLCFAFGFFFESIFGFGGGLIAYSILAFFVDLKLAILCGLYVGTLASLQILFGALKGFNSKIFFNLLPIALIGSLLGSFVFSDVSSKNLSLFFGILLLILAIRTYFFESYKFPKIFKQKLLLIGAFCQGIFGVGGPFVVNAISNDFKNKSELRTTMAAYFLFCNLARFIQLSASQKLNLEFLNHSWWIFMPVYASIWLGHKFHLKIKETSFKKGLVFITSFAGLRFISIWIEANF